MGKKLLFILTIFIFLGACSEEEEKIFNEKEYSVEDIYFEYEGGITGKGARIFVDTEQETFVLQHSDVDFIKTEKEHSVIKVHSMDEKDINIEADLYIPMKDVSSISKKYTKAYDSTMRFKK